MTGKRSSRYSTRAISACKSFAVVGSGSIGLPVAAGLAAKNVSVILISRSSTKTPPSGVQLVQVDTSDAAAVTAVLKEHKVDVVISTIDVGTGEWDVVQKPIVDAAKAAAVKLYVPSEFGLPTDGHTEERLGGKAKFAGYVKSLGVPYLRIYNGAFIEFLPLFKGPNGKIRVIGKGDTPISFTSIPDIAGEFAHVESPKNKLTHILSLTGFLVHILTTLPSSELENCTLRIEGDRATSNEIALKLKTTVDHIDSVEGKGGEFITHILKLFEAGAGSTGWDEVNKREGSEGSASGNVLWPGHNWSTIEEVHKL
ncbi:hypothetical protein C8F04DRAFT_1399727 [Mycena alexandri]|uniref:NmrA-like domain-containing protein n=1 Tax=Mycena alexandri TaxID=1745969 RepID=A0AAD6SFG0_9AGAR|nr:hypothetical protein C8F04DRAFT_1399727 [Mycena alexandri]